MSKEEAAKLLGVTVEDMDTMGPPAFDVADMHRRLMVKHLIEETSKRNSHLFRRLAKGPNPDSR